MRKCLLPCLLFLAYSLAAQTGKFDAITYPVLKGWKKVNKNGVLIISNINNNTGGYCIISLYPAVTSKGDVQKDFEDGWRDIAIKTYNAPPNPATEAQTLQGGWKALMAASPVVTDSINSILLLSAISGYKKTVYITANLNDQAYMAVLDSFLSKITLDKKAVVKKVVPNPATFTNPPPATINNTLVGSWEKSSSIPSMYTNGVLTNIAYAGYTKGRYVLDKNGTYIFQGESWSGYYNSNEYRLMDENGTWSADEKQLTISPVKTVYRVVDRDGKLKKSENLSLTKRTYGWQAYYYEGIQETNLVLTATKENAIDGGFSPSEQFKNAFLYSPAKKLEFRFLPLK